MDHSLLIVAYVSAVLKDDPKKPKLERKDQKLGDRIVSLLRQNEEGYLEISEEVTLTTTADEALDEDYDPEAALEPDEKLFDTIGSPQMVIFGNRLVRIEQVQEAVEWYPLQGFHKNGLRKRRQPSAMYNRFAFLNTEYDLRRLVFYEKEGEIKPDRRAVIAFISMELYRRTLAAINSGHILHDSTLCAMISEIKHAFKIETSFHGSHTWLNTWKRAHRISSRSITRFVSKKTFTEKHVLEARMEQFLREARVSFQNYDPLRVYNCDQSGFQKELYTQRTLTTTGVQDVEVITSSSSGVTHSYTVLPMIRLDGVLHSKLYVVFAESTVVFTDEVADDILLVADAWPCWTKTEVIDTVRPPHKQVDTVIIPAGATGQIQPLDIGIFRQFKKIMKNLTEYAQRMHQEFMPHQRDSIIKMISQTYWMLCSPVFQEWRYYAWYSGGYVDQRPPAFDKPTDVIFRRNVYGPCQLQGCQRLSMMCCPYCSKNICFQEFIINCHRCVRTS